MALEQRKKKTRVSKKLQLSATYIFMKTKLKKRRVYKCVYFLNTTFLLCKLQNKNYNNHKLNRDTGHTRVSAYFAYNNSNVYHVAFIHFLNITFLLRISFT